ncbi:MAG: hypothetical protein IKZ49_01900 [Alphaproteobacteria bacterium]|nr:hypothetical protein [Alphaproteobacteria bacterium]
MEKLEISEIIKISDYLSKDEWIVPLLNMNKNGKLKYFLELIGRTDILDKIIEDRNNKKTR